MVNKTCFRKSVIKDFVSIFIIIVWLFVAGIGYLIFGALIPILTPFGTAFNWTIISYILILVFFCFFPFLGKPEDLKEVQTPALVFVGYMFGAVPFISYNTVALRENNFPDIIPVTIVWVILMLICIPISMGYARCRNE